MGTNKNVAIIVGAVLTLIGILGFFMDPILGIFSVNLAHNIVHILTGLAGLYFGLAADGANAKGYNRTMGIVYALIFLAGWLVPAIAAIFDMNMADHYLHIALTLIFAGVGFLVND